MFSEGTIVAQASARGASARGVVRLSGDDSLNAVAPLFFKREPSEEFPPENLDARRVDASALFDDASRPGIADGWLAPWGADASELLVPCALFYWPAGRGFTGELAVELHRPGAPPILDATVATICESGLARLANRGEFALRAFLGGRLDLTQAEAILGTVDAESDAELRVALKQLSGSLAREFDELRENLFDLLCDLEAGFDFAEEDIEFATRDELRERLGAAEKRVADALDRAKSEIGLDRTPRVALAGSPNVGKSSLFNALTERFGTGEFDRALVSDRAGTTRDYLERELTVDGISFLLVDSAGVEETTEEDESAPRALAQRVLARVFADATLVLKCLENPDAPDPLVDAAIPPEIPTLVGLTKRDDARGRDASGAVSTSAATGFGIERLAREIVAKLRDGFENGEIVPSTAIRCRESLREASDVLRNALAILDDAAICDDFLIAGELRVALDRLGIVTGAVCAEDLLDRIFSRFCIGK